MNRYDKSMNKWNEIFGEEKGSVPRTSNTGIEAFNQALDWFCENTETVLDFGCGNGSLLFYCAKRGTKYHIGIDFSDNAIEQAETRSSNMNAGRYEFIVGSIEQLSKFTSESIDGVLLSNIIDNLYPQDADSLLMECRRILKNMGKLFVKINDYIVPEQVKDWKLIELEKNVYDDGFILWNQKDKEWLEFLNNAFCLESFDKIYYPMYLQYNRVIKLVKQ